jgi:ATP-dependent RNA helicase HelY
MLTPGQFTQLTGRAGRRGLDTRGYAVVVDSRSLRATEVAGLISTRLYPLYSSFAPGYNMVANLLNDQHNSEEYIREVLQKSFAQYQLDTKSGEIERQIRDFEGMLEPLRDASPKDVHAQKRMRKMKQRIKALTAEFEHNQVKIVDEFYHHLGVLKSLGYVQTSENGHDLLTLKGQLLKIYYCEHVLVFINAMVQGVFDELSTEEFATVLSAFISVSRKSRVEVLRKSAVAKSTTENVANSFEYLLEQHKSIRMQEIEAGAEVVDEAEGLNFGLSEAIYQYMTTGSLAEVLGDNVRSEISIGDFVRAARGVMDMSMQIYRNNSDEFGNSRLASLALSVYERLHNFFAEIDDDADSVETGAAE